MAVSTTDTYSGPYVANGVTVAFPFTFKAVSADDVAVVIVDSAGVDTIIEPDAYSVVLADNGGTVTCAVAPLEGNVYVVLEPSFLQAVEFASGQPFSPNVVNQVNDRDVLRALYLKSKIDRTPVTPIGGGVDGQFPVVTPGGGWGFASGTGNDPAFRADAASTDPGKGASLLGYKRNGLTAAQARTLAQKSHDRFDFRDMLGADLTGANSMATTMQAAVNHAVANKANLHVPVGKITLDGTINITDSLAILGEGCATGKAIAGYNGVSVGTATQFHLAHSGKGFALDGGGQVFDWVLFRDIMTIRDQPEPTTVVGSFEPGDFDYDFDVYNAAGLQLQNVCMLNPTRGINLRGGGSIGRLWTDNLMGQPLLVGVNVELAADVSRMHNTHFWPFWHDQIEVHRWTLENADHLWLKRCDTPLLSNYFSIGSRSAMRFSSGTYGSSKKGMGTNIDIDYCQIGIWFDDTCDGAWFTGTNVSIQGAGETELANTPGIPSRKNILMEGSGGNFLHLANLELGGSSGSAIGLDTASQNIEVNDKFWMHTYGEASGNTDAAINVVAGSSFKTTSSIFYEAPGAGPLIGGAGRFDGIKQFYGPGITPQSGAYTSVTPLANFIRDRGLITGSGTVLFTDVGTGDGYVDISTPYGVADTFIGSAVNISTGQPLVAIGLPGTPGILRIQPAGGGTVGVNGQTIAFSFSYNQGF